MIISYSNVFNKLHMTKDTYNLKYGGCKISCGVHANVGNNMKKNTLKKRTVIKADDYS